MKLSTELCNTATQSKTSYTWISFANWKVYVGDNMIVIIRQVLISGRIFQLIFMVVTIITIFWYTEAIKRGKVVTLRSIPALDAIDEATGRCAELGRPVHFTPGFTQGGLYNADMGPQVMAGLVILQKVASSAAKRGVPIIVSLNQPEAVPIAEETVRVAYTNEGAVPPLKAVRFISTEQYAYVAGVLSMYLEERPAANVLMGFFWSESLQLAEGSNYIGAMTIGGTASPSQMAFFAASCDYYLFGEELFAARAYIEKAPDLLGSIVGQDILRILIIAITVLIWLAGNFKFTELVSLLKL
jgi:hypothetical protein